MNMSLLISNITHFICQSFTDTRTIMSEFNNSILFQVSIPVNESGYATSSLPNESSSFPATVLSQIWSIITIWRLLVLLLLLGNFKNIPLIWHASIQSNGNLSIC